MINNDKSCDVGKYLDYANYANCKCRKRLFDKLLKVLTEMKLFITWL